MASTTKKPLISVPDMKKSGTLDEIFQSFWLTIPALSQCVSYYPADIYGSNRQDENCCGHKAYVLYLYENKDVFYFVDKNTKQEVVYMQHECKITVLETKVFADYQAKYLANPKSGPCPCFKAGDTFILKRTPERDDFYHLMDGKFCGEAWDAISRYVYAALQGGSIMHNWTNDDRMMIACCNDGTRPVIFKIERIDIPETEEEKIWLEKQDFSNSIDNAYTG